MEDLEEKAKTKKPIKWGTVPEWITAISMVELATYLCYEPVKDFVQYIIEYSSK